ncbi:hypothetical protein B0H14DRAFT_2598469 [Mycena olivaceomarginata]|nr:hypothetical protein B0H14DRAFT_2598469 [Mycena olivaceomarginata]
MSAMAPYTSTGPALSDNDRLIQTLQLCFSDLVRTSKEQIKLQEEQARKHRRASNQGTRHTMEYPPVFKPSDAAPYRLQQAVEALKPRGYGDGQEDIVLECLQNPGR